MKNFILNNSEWVKRYLTRMYTLPVQLIERYADYIDWQLLSENRAIDYTEKFCAKFEDRIDWELFRPMNSSIFKGKGRDARLINFLERFKEKINWHDVSFNLDKTENPEKVLLHFADYWNWSHVSGIEGFVWTLPLLKRFQDRLAWTSLCYNPLIEWKYEWMVEFEEHIDWKCFYASADYKWDLTSILRFKNKLKEVEIEPDLPTYFSAVDEDEQEEVRRPSRYREGENGYANKYFDYCVHFDEFKELIEKHRNSLEEINFNENILWTNKAFAYIFDCKAIDILHLSTHSRFEDPVAIMRKYGDQLNWGCKEWEELPIEVADGSYLAYKGISANEYITWTEDMLDEFKDKIHWDILSKKARISWTTGIIEKYFHRFDKQALLKEDSYPGYNPLFLDMIIPQMNENLIEVVMGYSGN